MMLGLGTGLTSVGSRVVAGVRVSIGSGPVITGTELTANVSGLEGGETVTYQWTDDGGNISGATSSTYTPAIGTDSVADASAIGVTITVDGGDPISSGTRQIRYAAGSVTEGTLDALTIDDDSADIDFASDFTTTNLTGSYVITGLPSGLVDDGDGTASGTPDGAPETASITVTFTDQYGRTIVGSYSLTTAYRAQATSGADLDLSFTEDEAITPTDLTANWTTNGNTLTYAVDETLPTGLSVDSAGELTGTPIAASADDTYTLRGTDEYGRETTDTFTLEVPAASQAVVAYLYENSLIDHNHEPAIAADVDTDARNWIARFNPAGGYEDNAEFGFISQWNLPPTGGQGGEETDTLAISGWTGLDAVTDLILVHDNFDANSRDPDTNGGVPGAGESYVSLTSDIFDAWESNASPSGSRTYWIFSGVALGDGLISPPSTATAQNISDWIDRSLDETAGGYAAWTDDYVALMQAAYPALDIRHMDVNRVLLSAYQNTALGNVDFGDLFEDDAPHGYPDIYIIVGAIMYAYFYGETPSDAYSPPGGAGISSEITSNWADIMAHIDGLVNPVADTTAPAFDSATPADGATDVAVDSAIVITFDENVVAGSGTFTLRDVTGTADEEVFTVGGSGNNGGTIGISGTDVTLTPGADLTNSNDYAVRWTAGAVEDAAGNGVAENATDTLLNFTTAAAAPASDTVGFTGTQYLDTFGLAPPEETATDSLTIEADVVLQDLTTGFQGVFAADGGGDDYWSIVFDAANSRIAIIGGVDAGVTFAADSYSGFGWTTGTEVTVRLSVVSNALTFSMTDGSNTVSINNTLTDITTSIGTLKMMTDGDNVNFFLADMSRIAVDQTTGGVEFTSGDYFTGTAAEWNAQDGTGDSEWNMNGTVSAV